MAVKRKNDSLLKKLGFKEAHGRPGLWFLAHPADRAVTLVAAQGVPGRLDLFTEQYVSDTVSHPLNTPNDPKNICIGIPDHDEAFVETVAKSVVMHFRMLEV